MKRLNYNSSIKQLFSIVLMSILFSACVEDEIFKDQVEEGIPVEVSFDFAIPAMDKVSTRLTDQDEFQVNDLYVLIFDKDKNLKGGSRYYSTNEIIDRIVGGQGGTNTGKLTLNTTSGESYIYGVSNVEGNELSGGDKSLKAKLDAVKSLDDLKKITTTLSDPKNIGRTTARLVMSGAYEPETSGTGTHDPGYCVINNTKQTLAGRLKLTRLDSHITFSIKPIMKTLNGGKIISFTPKTWRVYNVPVKSNLLAQNSDAVSNNANDYTTSESKISFNEIKDNNGATNYTFDFYMLENRKNGLNGITDYNAREIEKKNTDGTNTGTYINVEPYATFVELKASMEIEKKEGTDQGIRVADVTYVIHLGYVDNNAADFKSLRNKKYTYNIQIKDVESIVTEVGVKDNDGTEIQPGVEGDVIDSDTEIYNLDAHNGCLILGFTAKDVENLRFMVKTPFATTTEATNVENEANDYEWIKFIRNTGFSSSSALTPYNSKKVISLLELQKDVEERETQSTKKGKTYYYTVYIDEYYYNRPPCKQVRWSKPYWPHFVNQRDNRYVLLVLSPKYSADKESSYSGAKYMISQKSIQTYYANSATGLGMEHENETGVPGENWNANTSCGSKNGLYNTYQYVKDANFSQIVNWKALSNKSFKISTREALAQCLSRNRDENGDGKIDLNELKWYLPSTEQLVGMFIGAKSLSTPLFGAGDTQPGTENGQTKGTYHYATSNKKRIWSEEGASFGDWSVNYATSVQKLRCVRDLESIDNSGTVVPITENEAINPDFKFVKDIFTYDEKTSIIKITSLDRNSLRSGFIEKGEIGIHHNFATDDANSPYVSFQVAKDRAKNNEKSNKTWNELMIIDKANNSVCYQYSQENNKSDLGYWRAPNQRELMIMYIADPNLVKNENGGGNGSYCRTAWKFNSKNHFGVSGNNIFMDRNDAGGTYIRCVRDIK